MKTIGFQLSQVFMDFIEFLIEIFYPFGFVFRDTGFKFSSISLGN